MNISVTETGQGSTMALSGTAELRDAAGFKAALIALLDQHRPLTIDLTDLERVDLAHLQLICSAFRKFHAAGLPVRLRNSEALRRASFTAGLELSAPEVSI